MQRISLKPIVPTLAKSTVTHTEKPIHTYLTARGSIQVYFSDKTKSFKVIVKNEEGITKLSQYDRYGFQSIRGIPEGAQNIDPKKLTGLFEQMYVRTAKSGTNIVVTFSGKLFGGGGISEALREDIRKYAKNCKTLKDIDDIYGTDPQFIEIKRYFEACELALCLEEEMPLDLESEPIVLNSSPAVLQKEELDEKTSLFSQDPLLKVKETLKAKLMAAAKLVETEVQNNSSEAEFQDLFSDEPNYVDLLAYFKIIEEERNSKEKPQHISQQAQANSEHFAAKNKEDADIVKEKIDSPKSPKNASTSNANSKFTDNLSQPQSALNKKVDDIAESTGQVSSALVVDDYDAKQQAVLPHQSYHLSHTMPSKQAFNNDGVMVRINSDQLVHTQFLVGNQLLNKAADMGTDIQKDHGVRANKIFDNMLQAAMENNPEKLQHLSNNGMEMLDKLVSAAVTKHIEVNQININNFGEVIDKTLSIYTTSVNLAIKGMDAIVEKLQKESNMRINELQKTTQIMLTKEEKRIKMRSANYLEETKTKLLELSGLAKIEMSKLSKKQKMEFALAENKMQHEEAKARLRVQERQKTLEIELHGEKTRLQNRMKELENKTEELKKTYELEALKLDKGLDRDNLKLKYQQDLKQIEREREKEAENTKCKIEEAARKAKLNDRKEQILLERQNDILKREAADADSERVMLVEQYKNEMKLYEQKLAKYNDDWDKAIKANRGCELLIHKDIKPSIDYKNKKVIPGEYSYSIKIT